MENFMDILRGIIGLVGIVAVFALSIALIFLPIEAIIKLIKQGMALEDVYTKWTILTVVLLLFIRTYGIISLIAEVITYLIARDRLKMHNQGPNKKASAPPHKPAPGSTADYERWKAEREKEQTGGQGEG